MKRRCLALCTLAILSIALPHGSAHAAEKVTWVNDWLPGGDKAIPYVAAYEKFFAKEGLDVTILSGRGTTDAITKIATGTADVGSGGISALLQARAQGTVPVKAIFSVYTKQPDAIFTTEGSGINSLKDLGGKKIATAPFSSSNVVWPLILHANNVDPASVEVVKVDPGTLAPMLATGQVAGTINWVTDMAVYSKTFASTTKKVKIIPWFDYGFKGYGLSLFASEKMLKERPQTVVRVLRAAREALAALIKKPDLAGVALKAAVPESDPAVVDGQWRASLPLIVNDVSRTYGTGTFDPTLLADTWKWVAESINVPVASHSPESDVDRTPLKELLAAK